jgi:hypothetical protein
MDTMDSDMDMGSGLFAARFEEQDGELESLHPSTGMNDI